jgi:TPR repeat protein
MYGSIDAHAALGRRYLIGDENTPYANRVLWRPEGSIQAALAMGHYCQAARIAVAQIDGGSSLPFTETVRLSSDQGTQGQSGDDDELLQYIKLQADAGEAGALMQMGRLYYAGQRGIPREADRALEYFQQAAEQGVPEAEFNIGVMESRGEGATGEVDQAAAYEHFERAADGGHVPAQNGLGVMNLHGQANTTRNATKARQYFQMAADQGDGDGMANLAAILTNGDASTTPGGHHRSASEIIEDKIKAKAEAFRWAELAAAGGHTKASILLGDFFRDGVGTMPDAEQAAWMYRKVAERAPSLGLVLRQALE